MKISFGSLIGMVLIMNFLLSGCSQTGNDIPEPRKYILDRIGKTVVVQTYADGFHELTLQEKQVAYYLYMAAVAGRDICYDQHHKNAIEIRDILEGVISKPDGIDTSVYNSILDYTKKFWINNGMYNERSREKFVPEVSFDKFLSAVKTAVENGANIGLKSGEDIEQKLNKLKKTIFDKQFEPLLANKSPEQGEDRLLTSANNLYDGVTEEQARTFHENSINSLNSKLIAENGSLTEVVYRIGDENNPAGMYVGELTDIAEFLDKAASFTSEEQKITLRKLIKFFKTGSLNDYKEFNISWLQDRSNVDCINGFIEVYLDALGQKGEYEGGVFYTDKKTTRLMKDLAENAQYFESLMPWDDRYKKSNIKPPISNSISVLIGTGGLGPMSPIGINLPNEQDIREEYGSKNVLLSNVRFSAEQATGASAIDEFALPEERENARKYSSAFNFTHVALHEVIGHGSGKVNPDLKDDPQVLLADHYSALEEARAECVALYHMFDQKMIKLELLPDLDAADAAYRDYVRNDIVMLRRIPTGDKITDDHMKATHLIVQYLKNKTGVINIIEKNSKSFYKVTNIIKMREGISELLSELMRIKAEGDYSALEKLINTYAVQIDTALRDEVITRCNEIDFPSYTAFSFPNLVPKYNASNGIIDVLIEMPESFESQQLKFSNMFKR